MVSGAAHSKQWFWIQKKYENCDRPIILHVQLITSLAWICSSFYYYVDWPIERVRLIITKYKYIQCESKSKQRISCDNFVKSWPILKILSPLWRGFFRSENKFISRLIKVRKVWLQIYAMYIIHVEMKTAWSNLKAFTVENNWWRH